MSDTVLLDAIQSKMLRKGRGARRPGAGRKPNYLKQLAVKPISAAEIIACRHPQSAPLTPKKCPRSKTSRRNSRSPRQIVPESKKNQTERLYSWKSQHGVMLSR